MRHRNSNKKLNTGDEKPSNLVFETSLKRPVRPIVRSRPPRVNKFILLKTRAKELFRNPKSLLKPRLKISKEHKKLGAPVQFVVLSALFLLIFFVIYNFYKVGRFEVNSLQVLDNKIIQKDVKEFTKGKAFFKVTPESIEAYLKSKHGLIDRVFLNKSFVRGFLIEVKEYIPIVVLRIGEQKYFVTKEGKFIDYYEIEGVFPILNFTGVKEDLENILVLLPKSVEFIKQFETLNLYGTYTFDNFGNLSILTLDSRLIKVDLREEYHSIDEQLKVLQNAIIKEDFLEINFRSNKLIVKYKTN